MGFSNESDILFDKLILELPEINEIFLNVILFLDLLDNIYSSLIISFLIESLSKLYLFIITNK